LSDLFPDFRDPLFGIIVIIFAIFVISFLTYSFGLVRERNARKEYRKLLKRFEIGALKEDDFVHLYTTYNLSFDSIMLLASSFLHKGDYTKAISVYLTLLDVVEERIKKEELLELLGNAYFKGGFLQRSKEIYLKILKFSPRNVTALKFLLIIYQKLKEYNKASEILVVLDQLDVDVKLEKTYIDTLQLIHDPLILFEQKAIGLLKLFEENNLIQRLVIQFLLTYNKELFWKNVSKFNLLDTVDMLWYLDFNDIDFDVVNKNQFLQELYTAKGYINTSITSDIFELAVLISIKNSTSKVAIDLNFGFLCSNCKKNHPIYESRCPHCYNILTFTVEPQLAKQLSQMDNFL
jgi:tetratricopeptide (TPR) repeat protein